MIRHLLDTTLTIWRDVYTEDGAGGYTSSPYLVESVLAQVAQPSAAEVEKYDRWGAQLTHTVHVPHGTDVARGDTLQGTLPDGGTGLRVIAAIVNSKSTYVRCDCTRIAANPSDNGESS